MVLEALIGWAVLAQGQTALVERMTVFHRLAIRGGRPDGPVIPPFEPVEVLPKVTQEDGKLIALFGGTRVRLDLRTGCVDFYSGTAGYTFDYTHERGRHRAPVLSHADVARLVGLYMRAADPDLEGVRVRSVEAQDDPLGTVVAMASPTHQGVPFYWPSGAVLEIDPLTGRLMGFMHGPRFSPPAMMLADIGLAEARSRTLEELERLHGVTNVSVLEPLELSLVLPGQETRGLEEWFTPAQVALGVANRGILAYTGMFGDLGGTLAYGEPFNRYQVWLDPASGHLLALRHMVPFGGGGSSRPAPFAWNLGPAPFLLSDGAWSRTVTGSVDLAPPPRAFQADRKIGLTVARLSLRAEYDAKQGLLRTKVGKGYRYGRPSEAVVRALTTRTVSSLEPATGFSAARFGQFPQEIGPPLRTARRS